MRYDCFPFVRKRPVAPWDLLGIISQLSRQAGPLERQAQCSRDDLGRFWKLHLIVQLSFFFNCGLIHTTFAIIAILNGTIQWHLAHLQSCAAITTV